MSRLVVENKEIYMSILLSKRKIYLNTWKDGYFKIYVNTISYYVFLLHILPWRDEKFCSQNPNPSPLSEPDSAKFRGFFQWILRIFHVKKINIFHTIIDLCQSWGLDHWICLQLCTSLLHYCISHIWQIKMFRSGRFVARDNNHIRLLLCVKKAVKTLLRKWSDH